MKVTIRPATSADAAGIASVAAVAWPATYSGLLPDEAIARFVERAYAPDRVRQRIAEADLFEVAVNGDGTIVAFAEWRFPARAQGPDRPGTGRFEDADGPADAELSAVYVLPAWQRQAIGRVLHGGGVSAYRGRAPGIVLGVARDNAGAVAFYRAAGYAVIGAYAEDIFGAALPELRMRLAL